MHSVARRLLQDVARCHVVEEVLQQATHAEVVAQGAKDLMEGRNEGVVLALLELIRAKLLHAVASKSEAREASQEHIKRTFCRFSHVPPSQKASQGAFH